MELGQGAGVKQSAASPRGGPGTSSLCAGDARLDLTRRNHTEGKDRVREGDTRPRGRSLLCIILTCEEFVQEMPTLS